MTDLGQKELMEFFRNYRELSRAVDQLIEQTGGYPYAQENEAAFGRE